MATVESGTVYQITGMLDTRYDPPRVIINVDPITAPANGPPVTRRAPAVAEPQADYPAPTDRRPVPQLRGRVEMEGEVVSIRWVDNGHGRVAKMTVRHDEGWEVSGTVPSSIQDVDKGDRVRFTARIRASSADPTRGDFTRPTQAELL